MSIPLHVLTRFKKVKGLLQALDDHVNANKRLEGHVSKLITYSKSQEVKLREYEQLLQLMTSELRSLRDGREHSLLPTIMFSPDHQSGETAKKVFSLLRPMDVIDGNLIRRGGQNDGGYVMLNSPTENAPAYSLGISDDVAWDLDMAAAGCTVYQYDRSIAALPTTHPNFKWFKLMIGTTTGTDTITVADAINRNGHEALNSILLKMDIETAEWDVFQSIDEQILSKFSQMIVELHCVLPNSRSLIAKIEAVLRKLNQTHQVIHVHANNNGCLGIMGGVVIPDTFEVTYVRRRDHEFTDCKKVFPTTLDAPDYYLGPLGAVPEFVCS